MVIGRGLVKLLNQSLESDESLNHLSLEPAVAYRYKGQRDGDTKTSLDHQHQVDTVVINEMDVGSMGVHSCLR
jgi:hypothetical protein